MPRSVAMSAPGWCAAGMSYWNRSEDRSVDVSCHGASASPLTADDLEVELVWRLKAPYGWALNTIENSASREEKVMQKRPKQEYTPQLGRVRIDRCRALQAIGLCRKWLLGGPAEQVETLFPILFQIPDPPRKRGGEPRWAVGAGPCGGPCQSCSGSMTFPPLVRAGSGDRTGGFSRSSLRTSRLR